MAASRPSTQASPSLHVLNYVHASAGADPAADTVASHMLCEWHLIAMDKKQRLSCDLYQEQERLVLRRHQSGGVAGGEADAMGGTGGAVGVSARRGARDGARASRRGSCCYSTCSRSRCERTSRRWRRSTSPRRCPIRRSAPEACNTALLSLHARARKCCSSDEL